MNDWYRWDNNSLIIEVRLQPKARRDEIAGVHAGRLRVRLSAPPVDGKANRQLVHFFADLCGVTTRQVKLVAGMGSRDKRLRIDTPSQLPANIEQPEPKRRQP
jgi:uncharacterized protein (TIGR00251 family)